mmetsp:Transcript_68297/g.191373  ORF Transcript_68297/g.191373 Transcript_68297/m.191373 type:complete len:216 (-) Transcript_68297:453-1100(-)
MALAEGLVYREVQGVLAVGGHHRQHGHSRAVHELQLQRRVRGAETARDAAERLHRARWQGDAPGVVLHGLRKGYGVEVGVRCVDAEGGGANEGEAREVAREGVGGRELHRLEELRPRGVALVGHLGHVCDHVGDADLCRIPLVEVEGRHRRAAALVRLNGGVLGTERRLLCWRRGGRDRDGAVDGVPGGVVDALAAPAKGEAVAASEILHTRSWC